MRFGYKGIKLHVINKNDEVIIEAIYNSKLYKGKRNTKQLSDNTIICDNNILYDIICEKDFDFTIMDDTIEINIDIQYKYIKESVNIMLTYIQSMEIQDQNIDLGFIDDNVKHIIINNQIQIDGFELPISYLRYVLDYVNPLYLHVNINTINVKWLADLVNNSNVLGICIDLQMLNKITNSNTSFHYVKMVLNIDGSDPETMSKNNFPSVEYKGCGCNITFNGTKIHYRNYDKIVEFLENL